MHQRVTVVILSVVLSICQHRISASAWFYTLSEAPNQSRGHFRGNRKTFLLSAWFLRKKRLNSDYGAMPKAPPILYYIVT